MPDHRAADRRVRRTRALLHGALVSLVHEKPYDDIVVKEILARADVGRSTFYAHYRDKGELLESGIRDLLHTDATSARVPSADGAERLLRFSLPFLTHVERSREHGELRLHAGSAATMHEHLRRVIENLVVDELRVEHRWRHALPVGLLARHVAAAFVLALEWWLEHPSLAAREIDAHFRALVEPVLASAGNIRRASPVIT